MDINIIIITVALVAIITIAYKILPHRHLGTNKPIIAFFPKYKTQVKVPESFISSDNPQIQLEQLLSKFGFVRKSQNGNEIKYTRGHILGDISIKLAKVNLLVATPISDIADLSIEAGWLVAFDTGDFWKFLTELKEKIENAT